MLRAVIYAVTGGVPASLAERRRLSRTLKQRAVDVLAFFARRGTSTGPAETINWPLDAGPTFKLRRSICAPSAAAGVPDERVNAGR